MRDHDIKPLFFDVAGAEMGKEAYLKAYPSRLTIARTKVWGADIHTEFSGIDHRPHAGRKPFIDQPLIYETCSTVQIACFRVTRTFMWSGGLKWSVFWHIVACAFAFVGGALWWRNCAYRGEG